MTSSRLPPLLLLLLLAAGCLDVYSLNRLRQSLTREFRGDAIGVGLTDGLVLTVKVVHAGSAATPCDSLAASALRIASFVRDSYPGFDTLQMVSVAFAEYGADDSLQSRGLPFRFSRTALQQGQVAADSASAVALCELDRPAAAP